MLNNVLQEMEMELKKLPNYQNIAPKEVDKLLRELSRIYRKSIITYLG
jgi:predicted ATP-grasp superfamily ATP-dependent carboligase